MSATVQPETAERTVYDSPADPYIGEFVRFDAGDDTVRGQVAEAVQSDSGLTVTVDKPDGHQATLAWSLVTLVDSTDRFECGACGFPSKNCYRCSSCGHDLAGSGVTAGRQGGDA